MAEIGELAPEFTVKGTMGNEVRLSDVRWRKRVLLVFYPGDNTPG
jgi:peroxiredoxin Q/BCP